MPRLVHHQGVQLEAMQLQTMVSEHVGYITQPPQPVSNSATTQPLPPQPSEPDVTVEDIIDDVASKMVRAEVVCMGRAWGALAVDQPVMLEEPLLQAEMPEVQPLPADHTPSF
jgi:hypothetical protein